MQGSLIASDNTLVEAHLEWMMHTQIWSKPLAVKHTDNYTTTAIARTQCGSIPQLGTIQHTGQ